MHTKRKQLKHLLYHKKGAKKNQLQCQRIQNIFNNLLDNTNAYQQLVTENSSMTHNFSDNIFCLLHEAKHFFIRTKYKTKIFKKN